MRIDLNADLGEGSGSDATIMPYITSANICCGAHAGNLESIQQAIALARQHDVAIGAHPGYADREHFGRREQQLESVQELIDLLKNQLIALDHLSGGIRFIKPHGALYHQANRDTLYANALVTAMCQLKVKLPIVGLPNSLLQDVCRHNSVPYIAEGFADRRYLSNGTLVPRTEANALIHDVREAVEQVEWLLREQGVRTICVHGDTPGAIEFVQNVRSYLLERGYELRAAVESEF